MANFSMPIVPTDLAELECEACNVTFNVGKRPRTWNQRNGPLVQTSHVKADFGTVTVVERFVSFICNIVHAEQATR